jgi:hypothetical protein
MASTAIDARNYGVEREVGLGIQVEAIAVEWTRRVAVRSRIRLRSAGLADHEVPVRECAHEARLADREAG